MRGRGSWLIVLLALSLGFTTQVTAADSDTITIGCTLSQSGKYADSGSYYVEAYQMWEEDINAAGGLLGRPVELIIYDDESSAEKAISLYEKLITVDDVDLILGPYTSTIVYPVAQLAERYQMVMLQGGGTASKIFEAGFNYMFLTLPGFSEQHAIDFFEYLRGLPAGEIPSKAAIIYGDKSASIANANGWRALATLMGMQVVVDEKYPPDATDLSSIISQAKAAGAGLLMAGTYYPDAVLIARTAAELNYYPKFMILTAGVSSEEYGTDLGELANGVMGTAWWHTTVPFARAWVDRYEAEFGRQPDYHSAGGYASAQVLAQAVEETRSLDNDVLRDYIATHVFDTVIAQGLSFDDRGAPSHSMIVVQWQDGQLEVVLPESAQTAELVPYVEP